MKKFAVIGLGRFGYTVATSLYADNAEVLAIDKDESKVEEIKDKVTVTAMMDCTVERYLRKNNLEEYDAIILCVGNIEVSVLTTVLLKEIGAGPIYVKAESEIHKRILEMIGVKEVIFPEEQVGLELSKKIISSEILDFMQLSDSYNLMKINIPENFVGKKVYELGLGERGINLIAIKSKEYYVDENGKNHIKDKMNVNPGANDVLEQGETIFLLGSKKKINHLVEDIIKGNL